MITAEQVKELREKTGAGMMDCKKVLTETNGDEEKAIELLRERGIAKAAKKSDRIAAEGLVTTYVTDDHKVGVVVEVNAETDFVAKNEEFKNFVADVAKQIADKNPATVEGLVESYIHGEGKIGVLVELEGGDSTLAKDICMQIAAARPEYLDREAVPADRVEHEMEILKAQAVNEGKPEAVAEKIVQGRIGKFYGEICLVEQDFVKDPDQKVGKLVEAKGAKIIRFARFEKGEGLQKREENFAEEVAKQING